LKEVVQDIFERTPSQYLPGEAAKLYRLNHGRWYILNKIKIRQKPYKIMKYYCYTNLLKKKGKKKYIYIKVSCDRPRWPKGFRVG